jgi:hypothetical protein
MLATFVDNQQFLAASAIIAQMEAHSVVPHSGKVVQRGLLAAASSLRLVAFTQEFASIGAMPSQPVLAVVLQRLVDNGDVAKSSHFAAFLWPVLKDRQSVEQPHGDVLSRIIRVSCVTILIESNR